ncbi:hypothetical protein EGW08_018701 [Elysia chlorotica]|uniref:BTB domain-containing protein n=1 Tax=Elysia chlorotica TaxID=188477 RepID=A0A433SW62_ELYCH|nr:hypothetical protein EGW08_018701 [Elysia chlorotica]
MDSEGEEGEGDQIYNEEETEEEKMVGGTCSASDEEVVENSETDDGDERENNYVLRLAKKSNESNIIQADMGEDSSVCSKRTLTSSSSLTPTENVSKNNSAVKAPPGRKKNASNSFREIVERAKKRSSVNVRSLNKNSSFMKTRDPQLLGPDDEDVGHYFIGDYLHTLWKKQVLCDVRIDVNNVHFLAHKLVLAAFSDVFTPTTPYPQPTLQFTVPNSSPEAVYRVFKYIYTASMDVRDNQLEETLHVGLFLGISEIKDVILEILSQPTLENIELYIDIQNRCGIPTSLMDYPGLYQNSLMQMLHMEKFLELSTEELEVILRDPNVLVETEIDTLHALALWAQYRPLERIPEVPRLLDFIIFEVISPANIAKIVQLYDPIFTEIRSRNKISEVFRFHALQLSNGANGNMECFVENIPGIEQDPLLDRVSYIPSQGTLAKYLDRPTLRKPSMHAGLGEQAPNNLYSVRHRSVDLATLKNTPSLIGMKPSQSSLWERRHSKTRQSSSNFNESRPGSCSMKKRKSFNRSNNSAVLTQYQEDHKLSVRDTLYGNGEIFEDVENINVCRTVSGNRR